MDLRLRRAAPGPRRPRRVAAATALAATALAAVLILAGCGSDEAPPDATVATATTGTTATSTTTSDGTTAATAATSGPLYENPAPLLDAAREEFGEIEVSVLYVYADEALLMHVDPSAPRSATLRHLYLVGAWTDRTRVPHATTGRTLSLDEIDPDTIRAASANAPATLGLEPGEAEIEHVGVGTGEGDEQEYVVALTTDEGPGSVVFDHGLQVLETSTPR